MLDRFAHFSRVHARMFVGAGVSLSMLLAVASASAQTFKVTTTSDPSTGACTASSCSLRQAIAAAGTGDTVIVPASRLRYTLTQGQLVINNAITIQGAGAARTVISGAGSGRVMAISGNLAPVRLIGLTVTGGNTTAAGKAGGGIAAAGPGMLILDHVDVTDNIVDTTAAGALTLSEGGGGIFSTASVLLEHSNVSNNGVDVPRSPGDAGGGGIMMAQTSDNSDDLTLIDSTVSHNSVTVAPDGTSGTDANGGGGIYNDGGNLTIRSSVIADNTASVSTGATNTSTPTDGGGGIFQFGNGFVLEDSTVSGNVAHGPGISRGGGGGVLDSGNWSEYLNSTIAGNSTDEPAATDSSDGGGGILLNNVRGGVTMANLTIDGNHAAPAIGGGINVIADSPTTVYMTDSIVAENTASGADGNCAGAGGLLHSFGYNLTSDSSGANTCSLTGPGNIFGVNPRLGSLAENGGPTPTQALLNGSRAINTGDPGGCADMLGGLLATDQRGVARPAAGHGRCDIGAYEVPRPAVYARGSRARGRFSIKLAAFVSTQGQTTRYYVQFARRSAHGFHMRTHTRTLSAGTRGRVVVVQLKHLRKRTTYRYRLIAVSAAGKTYGPTRFFTTRR